ncbi:MAG: hypothetical protein ACRYG5_05595 [Janthinobacterium lividum]
MNTMKNAAVAVRRQAILASILAKTAVEWFGAEKRLHGPCEQTRSGGRPVLHVATSSKPRDGMRGLPAVSKRFDD